MDDPIRTQELTNLMLESGVKSTTIEIVAKLYTSKSLKDTATELKVSQGMVKHRLFEACIILESNNKSELASLLLGLLD